MDAKSFYTESRKVTTKLSGGRKHFTHRPDVIYLSKSSRTLEYGENPYTLAKDILGDDKLWWLVADLNGSLDPMEYEPGEPVVLPEVIADDSYSKVLIF